MTYNELAQVLETKNPETGKLYTLDDLNVITMEDAGTAMLEDGIFVTGEWIADEANQDIAAPLPQGELQGLGVLPRQPGRLRSSTCSTAARRSARAIRPGR